MLSLGFSKGVRKREGGKMCGIAYERERERTVSCGEFVDAEKGGMKPSFFLFTLE